MSKKDFQKISKHKWVPLRLVGNARPNWMRNIPEDKIYSTYASGSIGDNIPYSDHLIPSGSLIGGIEIYRYAPDDPVVLNKDNYAVVKTLNNEVDLLISGPIKDNEHWLDEIPERLKGAKVLGISKKMKSEEKN